LSRDQCGFLVNLRILFQTFLVADSDPEVRGSFTVLSKLLLAGEREVFQWQPVAAHSSWTRTTSYYSSAATAIGLA
jgi:hypothetical protein